MYIFSILLSYYPCFKVPFDSATGCIIGFFFVSVNEIEMTKKARKASDSEVFKVKMP